MHQFTELKKMFTELEFTPENLKFLFDHNMGDEGYRLLQRYYERLEGKAISAPDACDNYDIPRSTLSFWISKKWVKVLQKGGGRGKSTMLDERDVAVIAAINEFIRKSGGPIRGWKPPMVA
jgi:hypothetical protein